MRFLSTCPRRLAGVALLLALAQAGYAQQIINERILPNRPNITLINPVVSPAPNGTFVITASGTNPNASQIPPPLGTHCYVARINSACDTLWQRWLPHQTGQYDLSVIRASATNIWLLTPDTVAPGGVGSENVRLWQLSLSGRVRRIIRPRPAGRRWENPLALLLSSTSCYVSLATTDSSSSTSNSQGIGLIRFDSTGTVMWRRNYGVSIANYLRGIAATQAGAVLLTGEGVRNAVSYDTAPRILAVEPVRGDSTGGAFLASPSGPVQEHMYNYSTYPHEVIALRGGGYALTTTLMPNNGLTPAGTGAVVRLDANYRVLWRYQYPGNTPGSNDAVTFTQVRELADGSLLALARYRQPRQRRCWLYRLDAATGAVLASYPLLPRLPAQVRVDYLLPVPADSTLLLMGTAYSAASTPAGVYLARVRIPNLPRIVTGTAAGASNEAGLSATVNSIQLFPNPATGATTLAVPAALLRQGATLALYNALGQRVRWQAVPAVASASEVRIALDLNGVPPGVFSVQLTTMQGTTVKRLVVD